MVCSGAGTDFGLSPDLLQACEDFDVVDVGPELQPVPEVKVECLRTGGMFSQVVERESATGRVYLCKMAVVIFHSRREPTFPHSVARWAATYCGHCIQRQLSESNPPRSVIDLTKVAICMTDLASRPEALGKTYPGGRPRAIGVLPRHTARPQGSFDSPCCSSNSMESLWDLPAQAFSGGHVIANINYDFGSRRKIYLFIFMLPYPIKPDQPLPLPAG